MVETMIWRQKQQLLEVLDQTKLPQVCEFIACKDYQRVKLAIKRLEVRGAPAIGAAAAKRSIARRAPAMRVIMAAEHRSSPTVALCSLPSRATIALASTRR